MTRSVLPPRAEILDYFLSFDLFEQIDRPEEGRVYATLHLDRIIKTVEMIPRLEGPVRVLELGANPYFMTLLVQKYLGYHVTAANFFGDYRDETGGQGETTIRSARYGETHAFPFKIFNVEIDPYPYDDAEFDVVLCCEILEHLVSDPSHLMSESHRVLKPNGCLIVTTPNVTRLENVVKIVRGQNLHHPYFGFGVYGRHNREYTATELGQLLGVHHFETTVVVDDAYPHGWPYRLATSVGPLRKRKDNLFGIGRARGVRTRRYPDWLYAHLWARRNVSQNHIVMGDADVFQLGPGWYECEDWPPVVRWTGRTAMAFLRARRGEARVACRAHAGPAGVRGSLGVNGEPAGRFDLAAGESAELVFDLPDAVIEGIDTGAVTTLELRFDIENPFVPATEILGSRDARELGVAVERVWLLENPKVPTE
jgi:SAM-dependent methyltransferase